MSTLDNEPCTGEKRDQEEWCKFCDDHFIPYVTSCSCRKNLFGEGALRRREALDKIIDDLARSGGPTIHLS